MKAQGCAFWLALFVAVAPTRAVAEGSEQSQEAAPAEVPIVWQVWPLFDPFVDRSATWLAAGRFERRVLGERRADPGWAASVGGSVTTLRRFLFVTVDQGVRLRVSDPSVAVDLLGLSYTGGFRLGPLEAGVGVSFVPLTIEHDRAFELGALSPGALARVGLVLGRVRIGVQAFEEYCLRWTTEHCSLEGVTIDVSLIRPTVKKRGNHPLVFRH